jgi:hypothetical protein
MGGFREAVFIIFDPTQNYTPCSNGFHTAIPILAVSSKKITATLTKHGLLNCWRMKRTSTSFLSARASSAKACSFQPYCYYDLTRASGFNIATNLSLEWQYNEMMGFTRKEVNVLMQEAGVDPDLITVDMEIYYDGYLFHKDGKNRVYNPSMILYFFGRILREGKPPENSCAFPSFRMQFRIISSSPSSLFCSTLHCYFSYRCHNHAFGCLQHYFPRFNLYLMSSHRHFACLPFLTRWKR